MALEFSISPSSRSSSVKAYSAQGCSAKRSHPLLPPARPVRLAPICRGQHSEVNCLHQSRQLTSTAAGDGLEDILQPPTAGGCAAHRTGNVVAVQSSNRGICLAAATRTGSAVVVRSGNQITDPVPTIHQLCCTFPRTKISSDSTRSPVNSLPVPDLAQRGYGNTINDRKHLMSSARVTAKSCPHGRWRPTRHRSK